MRNEGRIDILRAERDYEYRDDVMDERDERTRKVLRIVNECLSREERRMLILFAESGANASKVARQLGVSSPTITAAIKIIRTKIIKKINNDD